MSIYSIWHGKRVTYSLVNRFNLTPRASITRRYETNAVTSTDDRRRVPSPARIVSHCFPVNKLIPERGCIIIARISHWRFQSPICIFERVRISFFFSNATMFPFSWMIDERWRTKSSSFLFLRSTRCAIRALAVTVRADGKKTGGDLNIIFFTHTHTHTHMQTAATFSSIRVTRFSHSSLDARNFASAHATLRRRSPMATPTHRLFTLSTVCLSLLALGSRLSSIFTTTITTCDW